MYHFQLRLHSSSWYSPSYPSAGPRIDYPNVLAAPVICLEMAVLVIPFIDVPVIVDPSARRRPATADFGRTRSADGMPWSRLGGGI
jgi:hypothetical protein